MSFSPWCNNQSGLVTHNEKPTYDPGLKVTVPQIQLNSTLLTLFLFNTPAVQRASCGKIRDKQINKEKKELPVY